MSNERLNLPSASAIYRLAHCAASHALALEVSDKGLLEPQGKLAQSGHRTHRWLHERYWYDRAAGNARRQNRPIAPFVPTDKLAPSELKVALKCEELRKGLVGAWHAEASTDEAVDLEILTEERLWVRDGQDPIWSAQPDYLCLNHRSQRAVIVNYKTGRKEAEPASDNLQLRAEVAALFYNVPGLKEIDAAIIEPLVTLDPDRVRYDQKGLAAALAEINGIVAETRVAIQRTPGAWCPYCPAKVLCPEARDYMLSVEVPDETRLIRDLPRGPDGTAFWRKIQVAQKLLASCEEAYETILRDVPDALPGLILPTEGRPKKRIVNPQLLKGNLVEYIPEEVIDGCADFHLAKIRDVFENVTGLTGQELAERFDALTREAVEITRDKPFVREMTKKEREMIIKTT